jgi:hypothetical protein
VLSRALSQIDAPMGGSGSKGISPRKSSPRKNASHASQRVDKMNEAQLNEFREAFNNFDKDRSGAIDAGELRALCEWVGQDTSDEEVANMMAIADGDKSGKIDFWEVSTSSRDFLLPIVCPSCARHMRCPRRTHGILPHPPFAGDG